MENKSRNRLVEQSDLQCTASRQSWEDRQTDRQDTSAVLKDRYCWEQITVICRLFSHELKVTLEDLRPRREK